MGEIRVVEGEGEGGGEGEGAGPDENEDEDEDADADARVGRLGQRPVILVLDLSTFYQSVVLSGMAA